MQALAGRVRQVQARQRLEEALAVPSTSFITTKTLVVAATRSMLVSGAPAT